MHHGAMFGHLAQDKLRVKALGRAGDGYSGGIRHRQPLSAVSDGHVNRQIAPKDRFWYIPQSAVTKIDSTPSIWV